MIEVKNKKLPAKIFKELYDDTQDSYSFTCDLIIKCGPELFQYYCHRAILASVSKFLSATLSEAGNLPVLILPDIEPRTLKQILSYVYNGEIQLEVGDYDKFIAGCELLQIKSLLNMNSAENTFGMETNETQETYFTVKDDDLNENETKFKIEADPVVMFDLISDESDCEEILLDEEKGGLNDFLRNVVKLEAGTLLTRLPYKRRRSEPILIQTLDEKMLYLQKAREFVQKMHEKVNQGPPISFIEITESIKLIFDGNELVAVEHLCGFCGNTYRLTLQRQLRKDNSICIGFCNKNFKNHLVNVHKLEYYSKRRVAAVASTSDDVRFYS